MRLMTETNRPAGTCTAVIAEVVGLKRLPTVFGIICVALVTPTTFAEPLGLGLVSASGYLTSQVFVGCLYLVGAAFVLLLRTWKITEIETKATLENLDVVNGGHRIKPVGWFKVQNMFAKRRV